MPRVRVGDLEIAQDLAFQRRDWTVQRIAWGAMVLLVLAALAGLLGRGGPLARAGVSSADGALRVEYERFAHDRSPMTLRLRFGEAAVSGGEVRIWIDRPYVESVTVRQARPQPKSVELGTERFTYVFDAAGASAVSFEVMPNHIGALRGRAGLEGRPGLAFRHFLYP